MTADSDSGTGHSPKTTPPPQPAQPTFEAALAELADLVGRLESGALGLSESIGAYERGVALLRGLHDQLAAVEERVKMLVRVDDQGRPILETPDLAAPGGDTRGVERPARTARPGRAKRLPGMDDAESPP